jgi:hypothetical protein
MKEIRYLVRDESGNAVIGTMDGQQYRIKPSRLSFRRTSNGHFMPLFDPDTCALISGSEKADAAWTEFLTRSVLNSGAIMPGEVLDDPVVEQTVLDWIGEQARMQLHRRHLPKVPQFAEAAA